uniref:Uncharacterized protein n=1 Tax=viral metagenome TaxID=1070528 RepID=A0A6M3KAC8_9ZZZZ
MTEEEITETAEILYNFREAMTIQGIKEVLWQFARSVEKKGLKALM